LPGAEPANILVDRPLPSVQRITLNRPEKRNALSNALRAELFAALESGDRDPELRVSILCGAGACFSSGFDLGSDLSAEQPYYTAGGDGAWSRHVTQGWLGMWDLAKPVIAQVHGYALAGGSELATACDLVYVAEDAKIGYPVVRLISPPDMQFFPFVVGMRAAMELMLTGDSVDGRRAVELGFANRAFPADQLEERVLEIAERVARIPSDLQQLNKRSVHRALDVMGARTGLRVGSELQALATHQASVTGFLASLAESMKQAFDEPKDG
jgi:enoyl-CoA hydratase